MGFGSALHLCTTWQLARLSICEMGLVVLTFVFGKFQVST